MGSGPHPTQAASASDVAEFDQGFAAVQQATRTFRADITQTLHLQGLDRPITSVGTLYYASPDKLLIRFSQPAGEWMLVNGSQVAIQKQGKPLERRDLSVEGRSASHAASLLDFFHADPARWHRDFDVSMTRNGGRLYRPSQAVDDADRDGAGRAGNRHHAATARLRYRGDERDDQRGQLGRLPVHARRSATWRSTRRSSRFPRHEPDAARTRLFLPGCVRGDRAGQARHGQQMARSGAARFSPTIFRASRSCPPCCWSRRRRRRRARLWASTLAAEAPKRFALAQIVQFKVLAPVRPGVTVESDVVLDQVLGGLAQFSVTLRVAAEEVARGPVGAQRAWIIM